MRTAIHDGLKVGGRITDQGSDQSPFLFAVMMDRLTDEIREESP